MATSDNPETLVEARRREFENALQSLLNHARSEGFVLTVDTLYVQPLAMGRFVTQAKARLAKELYRTAS